MSGAENKQRVALLDELRGLNILLMVFYHGAYDVVYLFGINFSFFYSPFMECLQTFIAGTFIILSGISCRFSRSNLKRGVRAFLLGMMLTAVTLVFLPQQRILFGILHLLGAGMISFALLRRWIERMPALAGTVLFGLLFYLTIHVPYGQLGWPPFAVTLPAQWYQAEWLFFLGLPSPTFFSSDYFPLVPWIFLFLASSCTGWYFIDGRCPQLFYRPRFALLSKIGRHALIIYLLHQPITFAVLWIIFKVIG